MATGNRTVDHIEGEEWRPVVESCGWYSVSSMGRVKRHAVTAIGSDGRRLAFGPCLMTHRGNTDGYRQTSFSRLCPYPHPQPLVHRLVFEAFVRPIGEGEEVNHKNAVKWDNRVENLESITHLANMRHAMKAGLSPVGERVGRAVLTNKEALEIVAMRSGGAPVMDVARTFGVTGPTVSNIMAGESWGRVTGIQRHWVRQRWSKRAHGVPLHPPAS